MAAAEVYVAEICSAEEDDEFIYPDEQ